MALLDLDGVTKRFGDATAVADLSLAVERGELVCLLGPSGCGKSTTLRTVAGLETPDAGRVRLDGTDVTDTPPERRDCSLVFQDWALFPNKSVLENVAFGPKMRGVDRETRRARARDLLSTVEMESFADADPTALSGGQKQRVALARSLALDPSLLLLDEPLSNLDRQLREQMQVELADLQADLGTTMLYVTHDQDEAFTLADRIGVMRDGELVQVGRPDAVYDDPADRFVESFLGSTTFVDATVRVDGSERALETPFGTVAPPFEASVGDGEQVAVSVRPESLRVEPTGEPPEAAGRTGDDGEASDRGPGSGSQPGGPAGERSHVRQRPVDGARDDSGADGRGTPTAVTTGTVEHVTRRRSTVRYRVTVGSATVATERPAGDAPSVASGATVTVRWDPDRARYFRVEGGRLR